TGSSPEPPNRRNPTQYAPAAQPLSERPPPRQCPGGRSRYGLDVDCDVFGVEVFLDALVAALAPEARLLDAAEGRLGVGDDALVEADHAGLQPFADADRALEVAV